VWDFDRSLGAYWDDRARVVDSWSGLGGQIDLWQYGWWGILAEDPEFVQGWIDRWQSLRTAQLSTTALTTLAQSLADSVGQEAAARDAARWPDNVSPYGTYTAQIEMLKDWLTRRTAWIDSQFVAPPSASSESGQRTFVPPEGAVLAYTRDGTDPRTVGGALSPNAELIAEPLTVSDSAAVRVRSYNPNRPASMPTSPWSSVIGAR
jgi:hypothetical protein